VRFLIGPNGAGKTTLVDAVTGLVKATGSVRFGERELLGAEVHRIARLGVGRTFQTAAVFENLTVLQNLDIAAGTGRGAWTMVRRRRGIPERVQEALETIGLTRQLDQAAGTLAHGQKQWLEIGMLLVQDAKLLLLDEPVAGMSHDERDATGELIGKVSRDRTVVVIEHDMDFLRRHSGDLSADQRRRARDAGERHRGSREPPLPGSRSECLDRHRDRPSATPRTRRRPGR
jgi:urea transport system ATP-binding protein